MIFGYSVAQRNEENSGLLIKASRDRDREIEREREWETDRERVANEIPGSLRRWQNCPW